MSQSQQLRNLLIGRPPCKEETKEKIRLANLGQKRSTETKIKISESCKGKIVSLETRKKLSESGKAYWNKIKQGDK